MRALLLITVLIPTFALAGLERLGVTNLNFEYASPSGTGNAEKIDIGLFKVRNDVVTIEKQFDDSFLARTGIISFQWMKPWDFLVSMEKLHLTNANLTAGKLKHSASVAKLTMLNKGDFRILNGQVNCEGTSELPELEGRLMEDCRENLKAEADRVDVPLDAFLVDVLSRIPVPQEEEPLKHFSLTVKDGDFYMYFLASMVVKAGLRTWGAFHYEDEMKSLVIRIDQIKFGILPVTSIVMRELRARIKDPRIQIEPPFIRVRLKE